MSQIFQEANCLRNCLAAVDESSTCRTKVISDHSVSNLGCSCYRSGGSLTSSDFKLARNVAKIATNPCLLDPFKDLGANCLTMVLRSKFDPSYSVRVDFIRAFVLVFWCRVA